MSDRPPILSAHNLRKVYLERAILEDVSFAVNEGDRIALMGANGAGKSTLLGIIAGKVPTDGGDVRRRRDLTVSYLDQEGGLNDANTVGEAIEAAFADVRAMEAEIDGIHERLETEHTGPVADRLLRRQAEIEERLEQRDVHTLESRKAEAARELGVPPYDRIVGELSGGERRRVALCRTLLEGSELLLLDEPTNHLDAETLDWLEVWLAAYRGTVILVTHDRYFLDNVTTTMVEIWRGRALVYPGNYSDYLAAKEIEADRDRRTEATRQILLRRELEWLRRQPRARTTKSKSRIDRAHDLIASKPLAADGSMQMLIPPGPRLGRTLVEVDKVSYTIAGRRLIDKLEFTLGPGDRVGVVGRNGLGKTTLLRLIMKTLEPDEGEVRHGSTIKFVYADQARASLDPEKTVLQEVAGDMEWVEIAGRRMNFRSWLAQFLFDENTSAMPIKLLSGGERNRVQLAKMLREGGNVVVLDEPTNDLDLPTLRILEESLANFEGCAFIVSHDRYFLNRVATRIIGFHGDGRIDIVEGNYDHYRAYLDRTATGAAPSKSAAKPAAEEPRKAAPVAKLGFKEQREFDGIEAVIAEAEAAAAKIEAKLADPDTFAKSSKAQIKELTDKLSAAKAEVERLYARWTELGERAR